MPRNSAPIAEYFALLSSTCLTTLRREVALEGFRARLFFFSALFSFASSYFFCCSSTHVSRKKSLLVYFFRQLPSTNGSRSESWGGGIACSYWCLMLSTRPELRNC